MEEVGCGVDRLEATPYTRFMLIEATLTALCQDAIHTSLNIEDAKALVRPTTDPKFGDFQCNAAMPLAKRLGKNPREIAIQIAAQLASKPSIASAEVAGPGFVNITLSHTWLAERLMANLADERNGVPKTETPQKIVVDFSSPNIAKQMHVGHLRSTIIGAALVKILRYMGHEVIGDNHIGDWGTQYGLLIVGMERFGDQAALKENAIVELERVYKLASATAKEDEAFADAARAELAKLQNGDAKNTAMWKEFVSTTRETLERVYQKMGVTFDEWLGESAYHHMLPGVIKTLDEHGITTRDEGAVCIFFKDLEDPKGILKQKEFKSLLKQKQPFIVQKKDGAFLYSTSDIATVLYRREHFNTDRALYVVDRRQGLHFKQLFAVSALLGETMKLEHIGFGTVMGEDGKPLKTRDGKAITLETLLSEATSKALARIQESKESGKLRIPDEDVQRGAEIIGIGAVKYADLKQNRTSDYTFDFDKLIEFSGNAGPYLQMQYARVRSIFEKGGERFDGYTHAITLEHDQEKALARRLVKFADAIHHAGTYAEPHLICDHLFQLAQAFSRFFDKCPVLKSEGDIRGSRLALCALTAQQLRRGLNLLGIEVLEKM